MPNVDFLTVSDEMLECAQAALVYFKRNRKYNVSIEDSVCSYASTPTIVAKESSTLIIIDVDEKLKSDRFETWIRFAKSRMKDTRLYFVTNEQPTGNEMIYLRENNIGLLLFTMDRINNVLSASDIAINLRIPELREFPTKHIPLLRDAYDYYDDSKWKKGFEESVKILESETRKYLKKHLLRGRLVSPNNRRGNPIVTVEKVNDGTIGALISYLEYLQPLNLDQNTILSVLKLVNPHRVNLAHKKNNKPQEARLRRDVSRFMWKILEAMTAIA